jgi:site-specific DNA-methyltransferase (adenine-specific)
MELMKEFEDKHFDLAIVDPPYGLEAFKDLKENGNRIQKVFKDSENYNNSVPTAEYFKELFRVSKNQIIWGANNFTLPATEYFCIWDKQQTVDNFATAEYAWVSMGLKKPAKIFQYSIHKTMADRKAEGGKIHPTQKPIKLYTWLLANYAKEGDKILDTMVGSASSLIACHQLNFDVVGCEIDRGYFEEAQQRIKNTTAQLSFI